MDTPLATPVSGFDHPIEMPDQCHQRIRRSCDLLHIATEEAELLPLARRVLREPLLARLGTSMARRRGLETRAA